MSHVESDDQESPKKNPLIEAMESMSMDQKFDLVKEFVAQGSRNDGEKMLGLMLVELVEQVATDLGRVARALEAIAADPPAKVRAVD